MDLTPLPSDATTTATLKISVSVVGIDIVSAAVIVSPDIDGVLSERDFLESIFYWKVCKLKGHLVDGDSMYLYNICY